VGALALRHRTSQWRIVPAAAAARDPRRSNGDGRSRKFAKGEEEEEDAKAFALPEARHHTSATTQSFGFARQTPSAITFGTNGRGEIEF